MTIRVRLLALFGLLVSVSPLSAGPIGWTYSTDFHAAGQPGIPAIYVANGGEGTDGSYVLEAALQSLTSGPGSSSIALGHFEPRQYNAAWQVPPTFTKPFELDVTIVDGPSGQSGTLKFFGTGATVFTTDWYPNPITLQFTSDTTQSIVVGASRYDLKVTSSAAWLGGNGDVDASVKVSAAVTPEPTTLGLAGVGLLAAFGLRRRGCRG
jgi:hypothetical protein